jgi:hypothetical protein
MPVEATSSLVLARLIEPEILGALFIKVLSSNLARNWGH